MYNTRSCVSSVCMYVNVCMKAYVRTYVLRPYSSAMMAEPSVTKVGRGRHKKYKFGGRDKTCLESFIAPKDYQRPPMGGAKFRRHVT